MLCSGISDVFHRRGADLPRCHLLQGLEGLNEVEVSREKIALMEDIRQSPLEFGSLQSFHTSQVLVRDFSHQQ